MNLKKLRELKQAEISHEWKVYYAALEYISEGYYVIPLRKNSKATLPKETTINLQSASRNRNTIEKWFHPEKGNYPGYNIGIATGRTGGAFAIDVDVAKKEGDISGFESLSSLVKEYGHLPDGPVQITPSGGMHCLFRWQEGAASSTSKIAKNIDTRGGEDIKCSGHIVAFPSAVDDGTYEWEDESCDEVDTPEIPKWVMDKLGTPWKKPQDPQAKIDEFEFEVEVPIDQLARMLEYIQIDELSYEEWLAVGQGINTQHPGKQGLDLWDKWSSKGERYKQNECIIRWRGFDPDGPVRIGTLQWMARKGGWVPGPEDIITDKFQEEIARVNEEYALISVGGSMRILWEFPSYDPMLPRYQLMEREAFRVKMANKPIMITVLDSKGNPKTTMKNIADVWLGHPSRREYPMGMGLFPEGAPLGFYNLWKGYSVKPREGDCEGYLEHIRKVLCREDKDYYNWVIDWMADCVQDPGNPKGCALVMKGNEGTGKGTIATWFGRLFAPHFAHLTDTSHMVSNFTAAIDYKIVIFADEVVWGGNQKAAGKLKGLVTEKYIVSERKGIDHVQVRNMAHIIMASNEDFVVPAGPLSRRWFVLEISDEKRNDRAYFKAINDEMNNGGLEALLFFLLQRKVTSNLSTAPETRAISDQREQHAKHRPEYEWWIHILALGELNVPTVDDIDEDAKTRNPRWPGVYDRVAFYETFDQWCVNHKFNYYPNPARFYRVLRIFGIKIYRESSGTRRYKVKVPPRKECRRIFQERTGINIGDIDEQS